MGALSKVVKVFNTYPFSRGLLSYTIIFPSSCLIQQTLAGNTWETYDWKRVFRFWIYGTFFLAPVGYGYVKIMSKWLPYTDLKSNIKRVVIDQTTYSPLMTIAFFGGMSLLEGKNLNGAKEEIEQKFLHTYKVGWFSSKHHEPLRRKIGFRFCKSPTQNGESALGSHFLPRPVIPVNDPDPSYGNVSSVTHLEIAKAPEDVGFVNGINGFLGWIGLCYWPIIQTVNFTYISEKNRVPFISLCGMAWTVFLAFMLEKNLPKKHAD